MEDGSLTLNQIYNLYKGEIYSPGPLRERLAGVQSLYKNRLGLPTIDNLLIIINTLAEIEILKARTGDIDYNKMFAIDNALRTLLEYTGIYHMKESKSQVKTTTTQDLMVKLRNLPRQRTPYINKIIHPKVDINGQYIAYNSCQIPIYLII